MFLSILNLNESCEEFEAVKGNLFNENSSLIVESKAHCLRKTAVWVRPRVMDRPRAFEKLIKC